MTPCHEKSLCKKVEGVVYTLSPPTCNDASSIGVCVFLIMCIPFYEIYVYTNSSTGIFYLGMSCPCQ